MTNDGPSSLEDEQPLIKDRKKTASDGVAAKEGDCWLVGPGVG
jgi:hypothetical protein